MSHCSSDEIKATIVKVRAKQHWSREDQCWVYTRTCSRCGAKFDEEVGRAIAEEIEGVWPVCIECDSVAEQRDLSLRVVKEQF